MFCSAINSLFHGFFFSNFRSLRTKWRTLDVCHQQRHDWPKRSLWSWKGHQKRSNQICNSVQTIDLHRVRFSPIFSYLVQRIFCSVMRQKVKQDFTSKYLVSFRNMIRFKMYEVVTRTKLKGNVIVIFL